MPGWRPVFSVSLLMCRLAVLRFVLRVKVLGSAREATSSCCERLKISSPSLIILVSASCSVSESQIVGVEIFELSSSFLCAYVMCWNSFLSKYFLNPLLRNLRKTRVLSLVKFFPLYYNAHSALTLPKRSS